MSKHFIFTTCLTLMLFTSQTIAAGDPVAGAQKVQMCSVCHGPNGNSMNPAWPSLAGQHTIYIIKQLKDYKSGSRSNPQMTPMAMPLSDQDIEDIAAYYAEQTIQGSPVPASVEYKLVEIGEGVYRAGNHSSNLPSCMACHGPGGNGNPAANYPSLGGQHAAYTAAQLHAFRNEERSNDTSAVMRDVAGKMTVEEIEAVSQYLQGLY